MSIQTFPLPDLGVEQAEVVELMVSVGDMVEADDNIALLESDKASMEVPTPVAGRIVDIHLNMGDMVGAGVNFISVDTAGGDAAAEPAEAPAESAGDNTDKPASEQADAQQNAPATETIGQSTPSAAEPKAEAAKQTAQTNLPQANLPVAPANPNKKIYAGPAVRKLCRQLGIDVTQVSGSAVNNRILKEDVHSFVKQQLAKPAAVATTTAQNALPPLPDMSGVEWGATHTEKLTNLQKVSIPQLCYNTLIPQVTQFDLADITDTENYRGSVKAQLKKEGISLTIVAFVIKAVAYALKKFPKFNSHLSDDNTHLIMRDEIHIGMAVATEQGLIVPVLRHADQKGLVQIAAELSETAGKARDKKIGMSDLTGAGFTISSQGNMGGTYFTPLVNVPQVAILGVSEATIQPRWNAETNSFEPRLMLPLSLSYDHRVINGADAAVFTRYLANLLSDIRQILH